MIKPEEIFEKRYSKFKREFDFNKLDEYFRDYFNKYPNSNELLIFSFSDDTTENKCYTKKIGATSDRFFERPVVSKNCISFLYGYLKSIGYGVKSNNKYCESCYVYTDDDRDSKLLYRIVSVYPYYLFDDISNFLNKSINKH